MKFKNIYLVLLIGFLIITGCGKKSDALKFKEEYEALNNTLNANKIEYRNISINKDNPFIYTSASDIIKKIENKETFYVYFGSAYCPWCRSVIETSIRSAKENNIDTIYYVDIWDKDHVEILRDTYKLNDQGEIELVTESSEYYQELLKYFDNVLDDYTLTDQNENKISVGEKRIFAPSFIYVERGKAIKLIDGISKNQTGSMDELNTDILIDEEKQFKELFYKEINACTTDEKC